jgi:hypothetical protein
MVVSHVVQLFGVQQSVKGFRLQLPRILEFLSQYFLKDVSSRYVSSLC